MNNLNTEIKTQRNHLFVYVYVVSFTFSYNEKYVVVNAICCLADWMEKFSFFA